MMSPIHDPDTGEKPEWEFRILKSTGQWSLWYACRPNLVEWMKTQPRTEVRRIDRAA